MAGVNVTFTSKGMIKLDRDELRDDPFIKGMIADMIDEGRDTTKEWESHWKKDIDGVFLICGTEEKVIQRRTEIVTSLGDSIDKIKTDGDKPIAGKVLPGDMRGHEHFGYLDAVSQPLLKGLDDDKTKLKGTQKNLAPPGVILINNPGFFEDDQAWWEPGWAKNGSYFVLRKMVQHVPEFHRYCESEAKKGGYSADEFGARLVGRWKNGAPVEKYPFDSTAWDGNSNDWNYENPDDQTRCPFAAHIRKSNPRIGVGNDTRNLMLRRGIPFGPMWKAGQNDNEERGLLFTSYQGSLKNGFQFVMNRWVFENGFPHDRVGQDAIIGQNIKDPDDPEDKTLHMKLKKKDGSDWDISFTSFITVGGGEYFFMPPLRFIKEL